MADKVFLHIGAPKSGTTFLQTVVWQNRQRLAQSGVLVPGTRRFDFNLAAMAVRGLPGPKGERRSAPEAWQQMLDAVHAWSGTAVISCEWFVLATAEQARAAVAALAPADVHIVYTARAFHDQVPAAWQEMLKLGASRSMSRFIDELDLDQRWSWASLDPAVGLSRWGQDLPPGHIHLVTVPPKGSQPGLLWRRFAQVCGIDADTCDTDVAKKNESLGVESARLLEVLGPRLLGAVENGRPHWSDRYRWLRAYVGHDVLVPRGGSRIALRPDDVEKLVERAGKSRAALVEMGCDVVGDLDELRPDPDPSVGRYPEDVSTQELLDVAGDLAASMLERIRAEGRRADRAQRQMRQAQRDLERAEAEIDELARRREPVTTKVLRRLGARLEPVRRRVRARGSRPPA